MTSQEFDEIYNEYWKYVYWLCRRLLNNDEAALDAAQDVFCRKWKAIHTYDPAQGGFKNWLTHNSYHQCIDVIRKRARRDEELWEEEESLEVPSPNNPDTRQLEWRVVLSEAIESLSMPERTVLILRFVTGATRGEVEKLMGLSPSKVRTLEEKTLCRLREWMQAHGIEVDEDLSL